MPPEYRERIRAAVLRPESFLVLTFLALVFIGTVLLWLPVAHAGEPVSLLDALFTATSAVCVTGLITVDTATAYSRFGQCVILVLIQLGGLGIMTFGAAAAQLFHLRVSLSSQAAVRSVFFDQQARGRLRQAVLAIVVMTLAIEAIGALVLWNGLSAGDDPAGGGFEATFLAVSAFCNAGFSVYSDSVMSVCDAASVMWTLMLLIVAGGLGYAVLFELLRRSWSRLRSRPERTVCWTLQTRVVLWMSGGLIAAGWVLILLTGLTKNEQGVGERLLHGLFQSVTARTAGFNSVDIGALPLASLLVITLLMFVGGSPGSCAGGIKTTTMAIWAARVRSRLLGLGTVILGRRTVPEDIVRRATLVVSVAAIWNIAGVILLSITEASGTAATLRDILFEQVSAFATVGLSTGLTPTLSVAGKGWIILTMFVGRVGPLTIAFAMLSRRRLPYDLPAERLMVS